LIQLLVSQQDGILPALSEFHYIKVNDRYGLEGNVQNYTLALRPDIALSRTKVRSKINGDPLLRRALNITSEMCQINQLYDYLDDDIYCTPKQLYDDLKAKGYDWEMLLKTRGRWTYDNDQHPVPFLSTMDLMRMRAGKYHPYWLADDKKTILQPKQYKKLI
jgi:hypothetical protein